jgi:hypothetical protein
LSYKFYIGRQKAAQWLYRDFILDYFGKSVSAAQKAYQKFVTASVRISASGSPGYHRPADV